MKKDIEVGRHRVKESVEMMGTRSHVRVYNVQHYLMEVL